MAFHEKKPDARPFPAIPAACTPPWATTSSPPRASRPARTTTRNSPAVITTSAWIFFPTGRQGPHLCLQFRGQPHPGRTGRLRSYWRDVGTIEAYYEANMDLNQVKPELNLYNREWPVRSTSYPDPPAKFVFDEDESPRRSARQHRLRRLHSFRRTVRNSVLGRGVRVHTGAQVEGCVIMDNCDIGRHAKVRRAILDKNVRVPEGRHDRLRSRSRPRPRMARDRFRHCRYWPGTQPGTTSGDVRLSLGRRLDCWLNRPGDIQADLLQHP